MQRKTWRAQVYFHKAESRREADVIVRGDGERRRIDLGGSQTRRFASRSLMDIGERAKSVDYSRSKKERTKSKTGRTGATETVVGESKAAEIA
jgi:hypothetical protein